MTKISSKDGQSIHKSVTFPHASKENLRSLQLVDALQKSDEEDALPITERTSLVLFKGASSSVKEFELGTSQ
ncbi:hypothetical protein SK128_026743, partial [Halocaridina rubra]